MIEPAGVPEPPADETPSGRQRRIDTTMLLPNPPVAKWERRARTVGHTMASGAGLVALVWTPVTISEQLGVAVTIFWAGLLLIGGAAAAWASATQRYLVESPALVLIATGLLVYLVALWQFSPGGGFGRLIQSFLFAGYWCLLLARTIHLRQLAGALQTGVRRDHHRGG